ncbi:MAG: hypothetical protein AB7G44_07320 [Bacteroidia bacterium]
MKEFAGKLRDKQICSDSNYRQLLSDISNNKIENGLEFLKYCNKSIIIELKKYSNEPEIYLEQIHKETAALIPELAFTDFTFQIVLDSIESSDSFKTYNVVISLKSNGKIYRYESFTNANNIGEYKQMEYFGKIDQQQYYKIFNKILSDLQSPYRLHEVKAYTGNVVDWNRFGIIALNKEQAHMLHRGGVHFSPSYESFKNSLSSSRIETAITEFQKLGLFAHLNGEQISSAQLKVSQQENQTLNDVLQCFPNVIYSFDTELGNLENPYEELLNELSLISKGAFKATNITDNFTKPTDNKALLKFSANGKEYSLKLKVEDDWIDPSILDLIKQAVTDNKLSGQFYELYTGGQDASIIFLTPEQAGYIRTNNLLIFADQWQTVEE